jgi:uncharacterized protein
MSHQEELIPREDDAVRSESGAGRTFEEVAAERYSRRDILKQGAGAAIVAMAAPAIARQVGQSENTKLDFEPVLPTDLDEIRVPDGYECKVLLRWGDPLFADSPKFDPDKQTASSQAKQFGYNCDYVGFLPLPLGSNSSDHGLLVVNHEYSEGARMFPDYKERQKRHADTELAAHGMSVVEIRKTMGEWEVVQGSRYNRRLTGETIFELSGPAAGVEAMKTKEDPTGRRVKGTLGNCAGGRTPWGTILSGEENFQGYFANLGQLNRHEELKKIHERYGVGVGPSWNLWEVHHDRFDVSKEPNEANRFGWVVEVDPYDPTSTPKKRTSLGRFRHEAATTHITPKGQVVLYSGDDARFEYVYKFVCAKSYNPDNREANKDIIDEGTLYVAVFESDGSGKWMPLVFGTGPLVPENGFRNQADVLINTRYAADLLGATKMDRPEDIEVNPVTGQVYVVLTNNTRRTEDQTDTANPRANNRHGHILEIFEDGGDHASERFTWEIFLLCGDPEDESTYFAGFPKEKVSAISSPDNIAFDLQGNLWIATDGMDTALKINDGFFAVPTEGAERGRCRMFFSSVKGSEVCGPEFTPDNRTLFLAIQHPGAGSSYDEPSTRWPDGGGLPPKPSVVVIQAKDHRRVGQSKVAEGEIGRASALGSIAGIFAGLKPRGG